MRKRSGKILVRSDAKDFQCQPEQPLCFLVASLKCFSKLPDKIGGCPEFGNHQIRERTVLLRLFEQPRPLVICSERLFSRGGEIGILFDQRIVNAAASRNRIHRIAEKRLRKGRNDVLRRILPDIIVRDFFEVRKQMCHELGVQVGQEDVEQRKALNGKAIHDVIQCNRRRL